MGPNLLQGGPAKVTFAKPSELHWTVVADKSFSAFCKKSHERAATEKKGVTPSTTLGGGGGIPIPSTSGTGEPPEAPKLHIPDPFPDNPTPAQLRDTTAGLLFEAQEMHVESLFETGSVRLVDCLLTKALMTEFARLGMILSENLVASLRAFRTQVKESCDDLFWGMELALSHLPREVVGQEPYRLINKYSWAIRRDTSSLLATVHLALSDMRDFLDKCLEDAGLVGETKLITKGLLDRFNNHFEQIQKVMLHPAMCNPQVSSIVGASMATLQPLTTFTFTSVVDQVIDRIGLTVPTKPNKDGGPGAPTPNEAGNYQVGSQYLDAQFKVLLCEICEGTEDTRPSWYKPEGLHLDYWKDFESRHPRYVVPALPVLIFDQAEEEMRQLRKLVPHAPPAGLRVMGADKLWQEICNTSPSQWQRKFKSILEAQRHHQSKPQPDPPIPSAPTGAPEDSKPIKPKGGGDPGDPEVKQEDKPQDPPSKPPGPPLQPEAKEEPEAEEKPVASSNSAGKNKRARPSKADPEELPAKWPTQPQVVGSVTLDGEAVSKDKASRLKCNVSLKCIPASDGSYIFKSDGDEGGKGVFDDDNDDDDCKVEIPDLNGDDNEGDAPNDCQTSKSDSKAEPDDEEDDGEEEHPKKKSCRDKRKKHSSHSKKSKAEEEEDDEEEEEEEEEHEVPEVPFKQQL